MSFDSTPYLGPMFPDWWGNAIAIPAVAASLPLSFTTGGALTGLTVRARTAGPSGNFKTFAIESGGALGPGGTVIELGNEVTYKFLNGSTTVGDMVATMNADSTLLEVDGTWNPSDLLVEGDDEFGNTALTGGASARTSLARYWGAHFSDGADVETPPLVEPTGPQAAATFVLQLENGLKVGLSWATDLFKSYTGKERRASLLDDPRQQYAGRALLLGDHVRQVRSQLARYAALGRPFLLGLPFEETILTADAAGAVCAVADAALDWAVKGQRVIAISGAGSVEAVIQDASGSSITLDDAVSAHPVLVEGARLMPAMATLFEPQQGFTRKRPADGVEYWNVSGRAALYGFPSAAVPGELELGPLVATAALAGITLRSKTAGIDVAVSFEAADPGVSSGVEITGIAADEDGNLTVAIGAASGATAGEFAAGVASLFWVLGDYDPDAVIDAADDFALTAFTGNEAAAPGEMGRGAAVTEFEGRPVWDRGIINSDSIGDSMHSLSELVDLGGIPFGVGATDTPDWGRQVSIADDRRSEWQWLKKFLATVKGRWRTWWLPTMRADLEGTADATSTTLTIDAAVGDYELWAGRGYEVLRVEQEGGTRFVRITAAVPSGDDIVLTVTGDTLDAAPVDLISWCELCRFEKDDFEVNFNADGFAMAAQGRVVVQ